MKLLLDQCMPRSTIEFLRRGGVEAEHVGALQLHAATDEAILSAARELGAVVVSMDADFHAILAASRSVKPSVIRIRIEGLTGEDLSSILLQVLDVAASELQAGAAVSVTSTQVRVRKLPLGK